MEDRQTARMRKYGESKTTRIMMATVPHVTSGLGLRKFQADEFLLTRVYMEWTRCQNQFSIMQLHVLALQTSARVLVPRFRVHIDVLFCSIQFYCRCLCFYIDIYILCVRACVYIYIYIYIYIYRNVIVISRWSCVASSLTNCMSLKNLITNDSSFRFK